MKTRTDLLALAVVAALAGVAHWGFDHEWKATLAPSSGSNITGKAEVEGEKSDKMTEAEISIEGATKGAELPWHVHTGKCGSQGSIVGAATAYPLLKVKDDGKAKAEAKLQMPVPTSGDYHVNVHKSSAEMGTIVACGDLAMYAGDDKAAK